MTGEDVPITITYTDDTGAAVDPDDQGTDGTPDAEITITDVSDGTDVVGPVGMTHLDVGQFEYVWDTEVDAPGEGGYRVSISADFGGETKIKRSTVKLT